MSLFAPVVRQVLAQSQEPCRCQLDRLTALKQRAHNIRRQIGQSNEGSKVTLAHPEAFGHGLNAGVRSGQQLDSDCESIFDQFDEACVDFGLGTIRDDEALPLAGASQPRFDRQGDGVDIRPLALSSRFQRRGDFRAVQPDVDPIGRNGYSFDNVPNEASQDVSGMAPPSRMMRAQRSRIAANMSDMAALIFKNIRRPWRTILPAV